MDGEVVETVEQSGLAPTLLLAMPQLRDPNFQRSVVLLCEHTDEGAMGLVVNRPTDGLVSQIVSVDPPLARDNGLAVWLGGPVEPHRGWLLCRGDPELPGTVHVAPGFHLSVSADVLRRVIEAETEDPNHDHRFLVGYAGWGPKQLDTEIAASAWLTAPPDPKLVFETPSERMWETAIRSLGVDPAALLMTPGVH